MPLVPLIKKVKALPSNKITVLIVPENTSNVKELKFSRAFIAIVLSSILCGLVGIAFILKDYTTLRRTLPSRQALSREVTSQQTQIQVFAKKIHDLNEEMTALRDLEKKIRIIANVKEQAENDAFFGVGGTMPLDLDSMPLLGQEHNTLIRDMHADVDYLDEAFAVEKKAFEHLHAYLHDQRSLLASTPAIRPTTGWISSGFGYRLSPLTGLREFHKGLDIATSEGTHVIAPADGIVTFVGNKGGLGKVLVMDHEHGIVTRYGHLKKWLIRPGKRVKRGDKIALVGNTGRSTGPHLHYEVHLNGIPVNPASYILN